MTMDICVTSSFCSFDGNNIVSTRLDGSLFIQFNNGHRYGVGYFGDPYKNNPEDVSDNAMGFKRVAVNKNYIVMIKDYDNMHLGKFDLYKMDNVTKVDDIHSIGNPEVIWDCKINPFKKEKEYYQTPLFLNDDNIFFLSVFESNLNQYIFNIKTNEWIDIKLIQESDDNWIESEKVFVMDRSKDVDNILIIFLNDNIIKKKYISVPDIKNMGVSRSGKMFSKFDKPSKTLQLISYQQIYDSDFQYKSYHIKFIDDKEFYTAHNILSNNTLILTTNKNIYVKFVDNEDTDWICVQMETPKDTYIINNENDDFVDTIPIFWNGIIVKDNTCVITTLAGDTYILYNIKKDNTKITKTQLPKIFCSEKCFNITFGKEIFEDRFKNKYKIQYFENN